MRELIERRIPLEITYTFYVCFMKFYIERKCGKMDTFFNELHENLQCFAFIRDWIYLLACIL